MRIRNSSYLPPPPPSTLSPLSPKRLHSSGDHITFDRSPQSAPHVMISRINCRINSTSRVFISQEQNQGISHDDKDEEEEMNFTTGNQSLEEGGWREEEKAMPLKKRRKVSSDEETRENNKDRGKMVKVDEDLMRCGRTDGRRWRCSRRRVEGYSMCEHHLMTRSARYRGQNLKREIEEEGGDQKEEDEGCLGQFEIGEGKNNNKRKGAKARSINSLLTDTV